VVTRLAADQSTTVVHGPRTDLVSALLIWPTLWAAFVWYTFSHGSQRYAGWDLLLTVVGFYCMAFVGVLLLRYAYVVDTVVLTPDGIDYHSRMFQWNHQLWALLDPTPRGAIELGYVTFRIRLPDDLSTRFRMKVSPEQARVIMLDSRCPRRPVSARRLRRLGIPQDWAAPGSLRSH
jgi:hypothetical protein